MRVIHIASFSGNLGDVVNHQGFYNLVGLSQADVEQIEIRKFYNNSKELSFDKELLERINSYDCLILGGGGFFDIYWDESASGITFNMTNDFVDAIKIPVLINAMGVHIGGGVHQAVINFRNFFKKITSNKWFIALRNDGSMYRLKRIVEEIPKSVISVPDNGFAFNILPYSGKESEVVGLSITNDLFNENFNGSLTTENFNKEMAEVCKILLAKGKEIIFFLHAPQDIEVLYTLQKIIGLKAFRKQIKVAPYDVSSVENALLYNQLYSQCKLVVAMRFHANVIAIKNSVPVIGLAGHEQIKGLFDEVSLENQCVIAREGFKEQLIALINKIDSAPMKYSNFEKLVMDKIVIQQKEYKKIIRNFKENV